MKYTPAVLTDNHVHQIQEIEQHLSSATGKELILIAYTRQPELSEQDERLEQQRKTPRL